MWDLTEKAAKEEDKHTRKQKLTDTDESLVVTEGELGVGASSAWSRREN